MVEIFDLVYMPLHEYTPLLNESGSRRGSALIVAIVFSMIVMFGLAGLLPMLLSDWKLSTRISSLEAAFSLAESGVDEAIWAVLEYAEIDSDWEAAGWTDGGNYWHKEWTLSALSSDLGENFKLDDGRVGLFRVVAEKAENSVVHVVSQGVVTGGKFVGSGFEVVRYVETQFRRPNPAGYGLVARSSLNFNGRPEFDRYDSSLFPFVYSDGLNSISQNDYEDLLAAAPNVDVRDEIEAKYAFYVGSVSEIVAMLNLGKASIDGNLATGAFYHENTEVDPRGGLRSQVM